MVGVEEHQKRTRQRPALKPCGRRPLGTPSRGISARRADRYHLRTACPAADVPKNAFARCEQMYRIAEARARCRTQKMKWNLKCCSAHGSSGRRYRRTNFIVPAAYNGR